MRFNLEGLLILELPPPGLYLEGELRNSQIQLGKLRRQNKKELNASKRCESKLSNMKENMDTRTLAFFNLNQHRTKDPDTVEDPSTEK